MDRNNSGLTAFYMQKSSVSATQAKNAIKAMSDDDFASLVAEYTATTLPTSNSGLAQPEIFEIIAKISKIEDQAFDGEVRRRIHFTTIHNTTESFLVSTRQEEGFRIKDGEFLEITLEKRIEGKTTYKDEKTGLIEKHKSTHFGFVSCKFTDPSNFISAKNTAEIEMITEKIMSAPAEKAGILADMMIRMNEISKKYPA